MSAPYGEWGLKHPSNSAPCGGNEKHGSGFLILRHRGGQPVVSLNPRQEVFESFFVVFSTF